MRVLIRLDTRYECCPYYYEGHTWFMGISGVKYNLINQIPVDKLNNYWKEFV